MSIFWNPSVSAYIFHCSQLCVKNVFITILGNIHPRKYRQMKAQGVFQNCKILKKRKKKQTFMKLVSDSMGF